MTTERLELSTKLDAVAAETNERREELVFVRRTCDRVKGVMRSMIDQSVEAVNAFANQVATLLVSRLLSGYKMPMLVVGCRSLIG